MGWGFTHGAVDDFVGGGEADRFVLGVVREVDHYVEHVFGVGQSEFSKRPFLSRGENTSGAQCDVSRTFSATSGAPDHFR